MRVDPEEILFMKEHAPTAFPRLVHEGLAAKGIKIRRERVYEELRSIKEDYREEVINEARRLLKAVKGIEYKQPINS